MISTNAVFTHKNNDFEPQFCVVDKVIRLSGAEYDRFAHNMMRDWDFIRDNSDIMRKDPDGTRHCLLVIGNDRRDGILVESQGHDYARYSAFVPNAEDFLTVGRYPALAELNTKLTDIVETIAGQAGVSNPDGRGIVYLDNIERLTGIDLASNEMLQSVVFDMLNERPEIRDFELDKNELIIYRAPEQGKPVEDLSDPSVTRLDMNVYGYDYDGMVPLGKERALELFDAGHEIFRLYEDDTEGAVDERTEIEEFDGLFGIEHISPDIRQQEAPFEVLLLNWDRYHKGEQAGEWLPLPADSDALLALLERIGVDGVNGSLTIAGVRMPMQELLRDHVSKHDSLDELNMLASIWGDMAEFEHNKLQAILSSGVMDIGRGTAALTNLLYEDNLAAFNLIDAHDAESLARYYDAENDEKPDDVSFEEYGNECIEDEGGVFTEHGYICCRYKELLPEYTGVVPDEYKILGAALQGLRSKQAERNSDEKPSVVDKIRAARSAPCVPKDKNAQKHKKTRRDRIYDEGRVRGVASRNREQPVSMDGRRHFPAQWARSVLLHWRRGWALHPSTQRRTA